MSLTTVRALVDAARTRHWSFASLAVGDGAVLLFLRGRLVTHVAAHGAAIEGLVSTTLQYGVPLTPPPFLVATTGAILATNYGVSVVTNEGEGEATVGTHYQDGWPVHLTDDGVPYVDFSEAPIATDPFGRFGGVPGFPLPADMVRLVAVTLVYTGNQVIPCDVVPEAQRHTTLPGRTPAVFVSGNRLVPVQPLSTGNTGTRWDNVSAIQISYVGVQTLGSLDDVLNLPTVLSEALVADAAQYLAMQSERMPVGEKTQFAREAATTAAACGDAGAEMLLEPQQRTVHYRG